MLWIMRPGVSPEVLGFIPGFLSEDDPRDARAQFAANYQSGWEPSRGCKLTPSGALLYPGDPPFRVLAETWLRGECIRVYEHAIVAVIQPDGSFEVSRMD